MFLFCYLFRAIWKPFYRRLRFWILLNNKKYGKAGKSEADRPSLKLHKSHKNVLNLTEIAVKGSADNLSFPSMLLESLIRFHHNH